MSISDDFNRADANDLGGNWTDLVGGMRVVSNTARSENAGVYNWSIYSGSGWNADQSSQVTMVTSFTDSGVIVRAGDAAGGGDGYMFMYNSGGLRRIYRRDNGSFSLLQNFDAAAGVADVKISVTGLNGSEVIDVLVGGSSIGTNTGDGTYDSGSPGMSNVGDTTVPYADNWIGTGESAGAGRTTKNTRAFPLGMEIGMNWRGTAGS